MLPAHLVSFFATWFLLTWSAVPFGSSTVPDGTLNPPCMVPSQPGSNSLGHRLGLVHPWREDVRLEAKMRDGRVRAAVDLRRAHVRMEYKNIKNTINNICLYVSMKADHIRKIVPVVICFIACPEFDGSRL